MRVLELTGVVDANEGTYDDWFYGPIEGPRIGDQYVIRALRDTFALPHDYVTSLEGITVTLATGGDQALYKGSGCAYEGDHGYSSLTPGSGPDIIVGGEDVLAKLTELDGQTVHLRVDDGP